MFQRDLSFGQEYEEIAKKLLGQEITATAPARAFSAWDFQTRQGSYEVKADRRAHSTGNFFIEFSCGGRDSGVAVTEATNWILFVVKPTGYDWYWIPVPELKHLCRDAREVSGGDGMRSRGYLLRIADCAPYKQTTSLLNGIPTGVPSPPLSYSSPDAPVLGVPGV